MKEKVLASILLAGGLCASGALRAQTAQTAPAMEATGASGAKTYLVMADFGRVTASKDPATGAVTLALLKKDNTAAAENAVRVAYIKEHDFSGAAGLQQPAAGAPARVDYYDLQGRKLSAPAKGVTIRRVTRPDGAAVTTKILR